MLREPRPLHRLLRWHHRLFVLCCWGRFKIQLIAEWPVLAKSLTLCGLELWDTGPPQALGVMGQAGSPWGHCPCPPVRVGAPAPQDVPAPGVPSPCPPPWGGTELLSSPLHPCTFPPAAEDLAARAAASSGGLALMARTGPWSSKTLGHGAQSPALSLAGTAAGGGSPASAHAVPRHAMPCHATPCSEGQISRQVNAKPAVFVRGCSKVSQA